jgi:H+/Cl- antiporter ClcA
LRCASARPSDARDRRCTSAPASYLSRRFAPVSEALVERGLILSGGAAGIAAAFNAPIAGIVFAIEEIGRSFEKSNAGT